MMLELLIFSVVFLIFGFLTDRLDYFLDEEGRASVLLLILFAASFTLAAFLAYNSFPYQFAGVIFGLLLASKIDKAPYLISILAGLVFILFLGFEPSSLALLSVFALFSFLDELPYFVSMGRPLLKAFVLIYSIVYSNLPLLFSFLSFDLGYDLSSYLLSKKSLK